MEELYKRYRPTEFDGVLGQAAAVKMLGTMVATKKVPHTVLFTGGSGIGKTTLARILAAKIGCRGQDFVELNCSSCRGIDDMRAIQSRIHLAPIGGGRCRVWLMDEVHALTRDAQNSLLKTLEDTPKHVYFMLCTTDPHKLLATIKTRCTEVNLKEIKEPDLKKLVAATAKAENLTINPEVAAAIIANADNSARKALVLLNAIVGIEDEDEQLRVVNSGDHKVVGFEIARALFNPKAEWSAVAKLLKDVEEDSESLRYMVLGYARKVLLGGGTMTGHAFNVIEEFKKNTFDGKASQFAASCYYIMVQSRKK